MRVETTTKNKGTGLAAIEAMNALRAEKFSGLSEDIPIWRFRDVLVKLGSRLGLTGGAVVYAIDLLGLLTEADWRGDGRAVTYHSVRAYSRKIGKSERTICEYERQLIAAGLAHRTVKHARRHGGMGVKARRTGLDWRSFGEQMPALMTLMARVEAEEQRRLDLESRIRASRRIVLGLIEALACRGGHEAAAEMRAEYEMADVARLRCTYEISDLERRITVLLLLRDRIAALLEAYDGDYMDSAAVDNVVPSTQGSNQSEVSGGLIDDTSNFPSPSEIRICFDAKRSGTPAPSDFREIPGGEGAAAAQNGSVDAIPLTEIWKAAPSSWKAALGQEVDISWPVLVELAAHLAPQLGVSPYAWKRAIRVLGPSDAALALLVLDRNRDHPARPVLSVGGALVGMTRRAEEGGFNLAPSVYGIMNRRPSVGAAIRHENR